MNEIPDYLDGVFNFEQIGPRRTQNIHFEAISGFGGSELAEQFGTRLEQVRAD